MTTINTTGLKEKEVKSYLDDIQFVAREDSNTLSISIDEEGNDFIYLELGGAKYLKEKLEIFIERQKYVSINPNRREY